jgi:hypothetical protein
MQECRAFRYRAELTDAGVTFLDADALSYLKLIGGLASDDGVGVVSGEGLLSL